MKTISTFFTKYFFVIILLTNGSLLLAQNSDWGLWTSIDVEKKLSKKWDLDICGQYRSNDNFSFTDQFRGSADVARKMNKYLGLGAGYELIAKHKVKNNDDFYAYRHRFRVQASTSYKYANFTFNWRPRLQMTLLEDSKTDRCEWILRNRFGLKYNIKKTPWKPYMNFEMFHQLFNGWKGCYNENRFSIGTEYSLNKQHTIELGYKLDTSIAGSTKNRLNVVKLGYTFSFK